MVIIQKAKIDLPKITIKKIAKRIGVLSEDVKMYMYLPTVKTYYALNDRTIHLLMKGNIDMSATTGEHTDGDDEGDGNNCASNNKASVSDAEAVTSVHKEKEVEMLMVDKDRTRAGGSFFPYLNITIFDLSKYGIFKSVDTNIYKHNCSYLASQAGGLSDVKLQELILTLRNRHFRKCDFSSVCDTLEIHIELISLRNDGGPNRVAHYGKYFDETYN